MWHLEVAVLGRRRHLSHNLHGVCRSCNGMGRDRAREVSRNQMAKRLTCYVKVLALSEKVCELILGCAELCKQCHPCPLCELEKRLQRTQWPVLGASLRQPACPRFLSVLTGPCSIIYDALNLDSSPSGGEGGSQTRAFQQPLL